MKTLHPKLQQAAQRAGMSAVTAAFGSDMEINHLLDEYAGLRLSVSVDGSADSIIPGTWSDGAAKQLDLESLQLAFHNLISGAKNSPNRFRE